jgi:hypothetical protein
MFSMVLKMEAGWRTAIDDWRREQPDLPSRVEAVRRLVKMALQSTKRAA